MKRTRAMQNKMANVDAGFGTSSCGGMCEKGNESDETISELRCRFSESERKSEKMRVPL